MAQTALQHYLDVALGGILVMAGVLKGQQLLADPSVGRATGFPRELLIGAAAFELSFGCWLLAGLYRRLTRRLGLGWFTILAAVSLIQGMYGEPSCACLGGLHTSPWLIWAFDVAAVAALWLWSPKDHASPRGFPAVLCLSLLPAAAVLGLTGISHHQTLFTEIDLGNLPQGGKKQCDFQLRNDSGELLEVVAVETSCPCASVRLQQNDVHAGQLLAGKVVLDLHREPEFMSDLAIEAKGITRRNQVAFVLQIWACVNPRSRTNGK